MGHFQLNMARIILEWRGFKFMQMKGHAFSGEDKSKWVNYTDDCLKPSLENTTRATFNKLGTKQSILD